MRNKKIPFFVAVFVAAIAAFSVANLARATDSDLIITEVMYAPNIGQEWIEVNNPTEEDISLIPGQKSKSAPLSWKLKTTYTKENGELVEKICTFTNKQDVSLSKNEFLVIAAIPENMDLDKSVKTFKASSTCFPLYDDPETTISLSNDYGTTWFYSMTYNPDWGAKNNGKTLEKIDLLGDNTKENWQESCEDGGTPGEEPKTCGAESDSSPEDDGISDPAEEASSDSNDKTDAPEKVYSKNLKITELLPNPSTNEDAGEFTEIYNADPKEIVELSGWKLEDKTGNSYPLPDVSLQPGKYRAFYRNSSKFSLNNTGSEEIFLKNPIGEIVDHVFYSGTVKEDSAYALSDNDFLWTSTPTPGGKNIFNAPAIEASIEASIEDSSDSDGGAATDGNVYLSEIMPNPKDGSDGEYIEIMNGGNEVADLIGWRIKDTSKSKGYQFKEHIVVNPGEYLAIYRPDSKIALNNSDESVYLYDAKNEIISSVSFEKSIKNSSYNFDGKVWKWSKYLTPGKKNKFDSEPSVKITKPKRVYKDLLTEFSAKAKDKETKKLKYVWDFGDGKKSTLAKTTHKYLATGKYIVTLSVSDNSQTVEKSFSINVKKSPRPDLEIVKIVPNPAGSDTEAEIIDLKNSSNKKIDLNGWKIATGTGEKIYNHPISKEFILNSNETKKITREFSKFSLNNKAGKVQLVMPDGKVIDEVAYSKEKISENEAFVKKNGEWKWIEPEALDENADESDATKDDETIDDQNNDENAENGEVLGAADENISVSPSHRSYFSSEDAFIFLTDIGFLKSQNKEPNYCPLKNTTASLEYFLISSI